MFSRQTYYDDDPSADFVFSFSHVGTEPVMMNTCNDIILLHTAVLIYNINIYKRALLFAYARAVL